MKKKVIHIITGLNTGGAEMMLFNMVKKMDKDKFEHIIISLLPQGAIGNLMAKEGHKLYYLNIIHPFNVIKATVQLFFILKKEKPNILHCYMFHADILGRIIGRLAQVRIIISSIRNENIGGAWREKIFRLTDFLVDKTTVVCQKAAEIQINSSSIKREKVRVIYNGVDLKKYYFQVEERDNTRGKLSIGKNDFVFISVGRIEKQKNHKLLLRAFYEIKQTNDNVKLLIVGDGVLRSEIEKHVDNLKLGNNVIFTGIQKDVPKLLAAVDAFVLSSSWEGMPNVVLEAMASALPVIATDVGGTPEIIRNSEVGMLITPENQKELAHKMQEIIDMPSEKRKQMGYLAREHIKNFFTIEQTVKQNEDLYSELLQEKGLYSDEK